MLLVLVGELPRWLMVAAYGAVFGLSLYCILGSISLAVVTSGHQRRAAVLRSLKEHDARERRLREEEGRNSGGSTEEGPSPS